MNAGMQKNTIDKINIMLSAILESDCIRDKGKAFSEMKTKTIDAFRSKLRSDKNSLDIAIAMYCTRHRIPWRSSYKLDNVFKTSRQFNYLANELKYYIMNGIPKSLGKRLVQMEFDFH